MAGKKKTTRREFAEEILNKPEDLRRLYARLLEFAGDAVYRYTFDEGRILFANKGLVDVLGLDCKPEELEGKLLKDVLTYIEKPGTIRRAADKHGEIHSFEYRFKTLKGEEKWVIHNSFILKHPKTGKKIVEAIAKDITERKKAEESLRQAAEEWKETFDSIADLVFIQDKDLRFVKVNKAVCDTLKVTLEDLIGKRCYEVLHKTDKPWPDCPAVKSLKDKRPYAAEVYDRNIGIPLLISTSPLFNEKGELIGIVHIAKDITERKKAEEILAESEAKYRNLTEGLEQLVYSADPKTLVASFVNSAVKNIYGYTREEWLMNPKLWEDTIHPDDKEGMLARFGELQKQAKNDIVQYRIITKDKKIKFVEDHVSWVKDPDGRIVSLTGVMYDISERKEMEETLEKSELLFRATVKSLPLMVFMLDRQGLFTLSEGQGLEFLNIFPGEVLGRSVYEVFSKKPEILSIIKDAFSKKANSIIAKIDDAYFSVRCSPILGPDGQLEGIIGVSIDITKRRKAEQALQKVRNELEIKVQERTEELQENIEELERFRKATIGREFRMEELRKEIERLKKTKGD